jgi:phospho-N-acetylmuramoyl-pentapeptide-transferase
VAVAAGPSTMLPLLVTTGLFAAEAASVIIQVAYYKATKGPDGVGKRLFRMAPFHHHLELGGWPEVGVVQAFYLASLLLASGGGLVAVF